MIAVFRAQSNLDLIERLEGKIVARGIAGNNTAGSPNFGDASEGAFNGVEPGDVLSISGNLTTYIVNSVTDDNHIVVGANIAALHNNNGIWRILRGGIGVDNLVLGSPHMMEGDRWIVFYESPNFVR